MLDHICANIPFETSFYSVSEDGNYFFVDVDIHTIDIPLASRAVHKDEQGNISASALYHPFESVPTHYTGMALKVFFDSSYAPYVQIKASPAKLLQGHNVFGSDSLEQGWLEMVGFLNEAYPTLACMLDYQEAFISHIDLTYSAHLKDQRTAQQVLDFLSRVSNGQTRLSNKRYGTTVYWGSQTSRLINHKCYLKYDEFLIQFEEQKQLAKRNDKSAMRVVEVMSDPRLINWTVGLARFESRLKKRYLERNHIPVNIIDLIKCQKANPDLFQTLWKKATSSIFDALRGQTMKLTDNDSVYKAIESSDVVINAKGKVSLAKVRNLQAFHALIKDYGYEYSKQQYSRASFYRLISDLCACGFSKAYLQNLHDEKAKNIIPFVKLVEIDFSKQLPDWYEEPVSQFQNLAIA